MLAITGTFTSLCLMRAELEAASFPIAFPCISDNVERYQNLPRVTFGSLVFMEKKKTEPYLVERPPWL